jgi:hypothetical protein
MYDFSFIIDEEYLNSNYKSILIDENDIALDLV